VDAPEKSKAKDRLLKLLKTSGNANFLPSLHHNFLIAFYLNLGDRGMIVAGAGAGQQTITVTYLTE
jgi:hypothetical protein